MRVLRPAGRVYLAGGAYLWSEGFLERETSRQVEQVGRIAHGTGAIMSRCGTRTVRRLNMGRISFSSFSTTCDGGIVSIMAEYGAERMRPGARIGYPKPEQHSHAGFFFLETWDWVSSLEMEKESFGTLEIRGHAQKEKLSRTCQAQAPTSIRLGSDFMSTFDWRRRR